MNKGILIGAVVVAASAGGMWFTKSAYEDAITTSLERTHDMYGEMGLIFERNTVSSSLFGINDQYKITLTESFFTLMGTPGMADKDMSFTVNNDCTVFPFYMVCDNIVDVSSLQVPAELTDKFSDFNYDASWSLSPLTNSISTHLSSDAFTIKSDDGDITINAIKLDSDSDLSMEDMTLTMNWDGMSADTPDANVKIGNASMTADMTWLSGMTYLGTSSIKLTTMELEEATGTSVKLDDITVASNSSEYESGKFDLTYLVKAEKLELMGGPMPVSATKVNLDTRIFGLSRRALEMMNSMQNEFVEDPEAINELLTELGANEPGFEIRDLSVNYNGAPISMKGKLNLDTFTADDLANDELAAKAHGQFHSEVGKEVTTALPQFTPMLDQYVQMGLVVKDADGNYVSDVEIKDRTVSANGNVIQQF